MWMREVARCKGSESRSLNTCSQPSEATVHKRYEQERAPRVEWVETSFRADVWQKDSSKREGEGLKGGSHTCYDMCLFL